MTVTISDIAKITGKNRSTVSRVLRNDTNFPVSEKSRREILEVAKKLNYVPAHFARSLATGKSYCVAIVLGRAEKDLAEPSFSPILLEMTRTCLKHGYHLTLLPMDNSDPSDNELLEMVRGRRIDGFYIGTNMLGPEAMEELSSRKVPIVTTELDPQVAKTGLVSVVRKDDGPGLNELVRELVSRGHRRIAFVAPEYFISHRLGVYSEYFPTLRKMLTQAGVCEEGLSDFLYNPAVRGTLASRAEARKAALGWVERLSEYSAIVANSDFVALGVADALSEHGLEAGKHYALVGHNNSEQTAAFSVAKPFLTTIDPDYRLRGQMIAELLIERIKNPKVDPRIIDIPTRLIVRDSMIDATGPERSKTTTCR